jgi:hypothetical protein
MNSGLWLPWNLNSYWKLLDLIKLIDVEV